MNVDELLRGRSEGARVLFNADRVHLTFVEHNVFKLRCFRRTMETFEQSIVLVVTGICVKYVMTVLNECIAILYDVAVPTGMTNVRD